MESYIVFKSSSRIHCLTHLIDTQPTLVTTCIYNSLKKLTTKQKSVIHVLCVRVSYFCSFSNMLISKHQFTKVLIIKHILFCFDILSVKNRSRLIEDSYYLTNRKRFLLTRDQVRELMTALINPYIRCRCTRGLFFIFIVDI